MELLYNRKVLTTKKILCGKITMDFLINTYDQLNYIYDQCCLMNITFQLIVVLEKLDMANLVQMVLKATEI